VFVGSGMMANWRLPLRFSFTKVVGCSWFSCLVNRHLLVGSVPFKKYSFLIGQPLQERVPVKGQMSLVMRVGGGVKLC
jgi:hypothetical protein